MKKTALLLACVLILGAFPACSNKKEIKYPTKKAEGYEFFDGNLIWANCYSELWSKEYKSSYYYYYYGIDDVPVDKFIACKKVSYSVMSALYFPFVYRKEGCSENPIMDYEVTSAEIYWSNGYLYNNEEDWYSLGSYMLREEAYCLDSDLIAKIVDRIQQGRDAMDFGQSVYEILSSEGCYLSIRIHFKEYENLIWDAFIVQDRSSGYYIQCIELQDKKKMLPLPEEFSPILDEIIRKNQIT